MCKSVQLFKALAEETRLRILNLLVQGELCVCDIMKILKIGQSKASRHLVYLRNAGLVTDRRQCAWKYYSMAPPDGVLHQRVVEWLVDAKNEIPEAVVDLKMLDDLRSHGKLCAQCPPE